MVPGGGLYIHASLGTDVPALVVDQDVGVTRLHMHGTGGQREQRTRDESRLWS